MNKANNKQSETKQNVKNTRIVKTNDEKIRPKPKSKHRIYKPRQNH